MFCGNNCIKFDGVNLKNKRQLALKHCANWNCSKCLGVMLYRGEDNNLHMYVDEDFVGKDCIVDSEEGCEYFEDIILPGIKDEKKVYKRRKKRI